MARDGWTNVASLLRADEAGLLRGLLESASIPVLVEDVAISALNPLWQSAVGGAKVAVQVADAERATALVSESGVFAGCGEGVDIPEEEWAGTGAPGDARRTAGLAPPEDPDLAERAASRAFRASFAALALYWTVLVPLYAVAASLRAFRAPGLSTPRARVRRGWALAVSALALSLGLLQWSAFVAGFPGL